MGVMLVYLHYFDVALRGITLNNAAHTFSLVGHPCTIFYKIPFCLAVIPFPLKTFFSSIFFM